MEMNGNTKVFKRTIFGWIDKGIDDALIVGLTKAYKAAPLLGNVYELNTSILKESFGLSGLGPAKRDELISILANIKIKKGKLFSYKNNNNLLVTMYSLEEVEKIIYENTLSSDSKHEVS